MGLVPAVFGTQLFTERDSGDMLSGWRIVGMQMTPSSIPLCQTLLMYSDAVSPADEPAPLIPSYLDVLSSNSSSSVTGKEQKCGQYVQSRGDRSVFYRRSMVRFEQCLLVLNS